MNKDIRKDAETHRHIWGNKYDVYLAAPVIGVSKAQREQVDVIASAAADQLGRDMNLADVYKPWTLKIPNAWGMPQNEWARCVFTQDVLALNDAFAVVVCDFGRHSSCGTAWEAGYAFAKKKRVIVVQMPGVEEVSIMVHNGCSVVVSYEDFCSGDWCIPDYLNAKPEVTQN